MSLKSLSFVPALYKIFDEAWLGSLLFCFGNLKTASVDLGDFRCLRLVLSCSMLVVPLEVQLCYQWTHETWCCFLHGGRQNLFGIFRCFGMDGRIKPLHPVAIVIGFKSKIPDTRSGVTSLHGTAVFKGLPTYCPLDPFNIWDQLWGSKMGPVCSRKFGGYLPSWELTYPIQ